MNERLHELRERIRTALSRWIADDPADAERAIAAAARRATYDDAERLAERIIADDSEPLPNGGLHAMREEYAVRAAMRRMLEGTGVELPKGEERA